MHREMKRILLVITIGLLILIKPAYLSAQPGTVLWHQKISDTEGDFTSVLDDEDRFGFSCAALDDVNGDGVGDIVVGAPWDDDGGTNRGAVWVLFLNDDGTVNSHQKISDTEGGFTGTLDYEDFFGWAVASLGDLDGNGVADLAVGATGDDDGGTGCGAVWVLFLAADGTVESHQKISNTQGGFTGVLQDGDWFGGNATSLGDLDGAGSSVVTLAVSAWADDDGGTNRGAVWVLFLNNDGTVNSHQKISDTEGGFTGTLDDFDQFGTGVTPLGDLDGNGIVDLAVGANQDDDGGSTADSDRGAVWVLFLASSGTVNSHQKISDTHGGFTVALNDGDEFGSSVALPGDLDGDGVGDLAVGAQRDDDGGTNRGAVWMLFLKSDGTVRAYQKISDTQGGFTGTLNDEDIFGHPVAALGDLDGNGVGDLVVGAHGDDDGGPERGAVWVLYLDGQPHRKFAIDIKPRSCPNPINVKIFEEPLKNAKSKKGGVLPVAILGASGSDVYDIDTSTLLLEGIAPLRHSYEDVATPIENGEQCECTNAGPDGYIDLTLKFLTSEIAAVLGTVSDNDMISLTLTGQLNDGTPFEGSDCITILSKRPEPKMDTQNSKVELGPAIPNPFNPTTMISFNLPRAMQVNLSVYNVKGELITTLVDQHMTAGRKEVTWTAKDSRGRAVSSGIYFYRLVAGDFVQTRKMVLLR